MECKVIDRTILILDIFAQRARTREAQLQVEVAQRQTQRKKRRKKEVPVISLVGYTNAGKSTIMNAFVERYSSTSKTGV